MNTREAQVHTRTGAPYLGMEMSINIIHFWIHISRRLETAHISFVNAGKSEASTLICSGFQQQFVTFFNDSKSKVSETTAHPSGQIITVFQSSSLTHTYVYQTMINRRAEFATSDKSWGIIPCTQRLSNCIQHSYSIFQQSVSYPCTFPYFTAKKCWHSHSAFCSFACFPITYITTSRIAWGIDCHLNCALCA